MSISVHELTSDEISALGVDLSMVAICDKIRRLASLNRLRIDTSAHRSGLNKHLLSYLEYCNLDKLDFIKGYLANLQPYMLERKQEQEKGTNFICVIDNVYRVSVYIKMNATHGEEVVISFHEDNKSGIAKSNHLIKRNITDYVPVFANMCSGYSPETGIVSVDVLVQRGLKVLPLTLAGRKYRNVFIVRRRDIETVFLDYCNTYISDLYTSNLNLDFSKVEIFTSLQQISFTSYGRNIFETISLLVDSLCIQLDPISRSAADFALVTYAHSLELTHEDKKKLISMLNERYSVSSIRAMPEILKRVTLALP